MWKMWINPPDVVDGNVVWGDAQRDEATRRTQVAINNRAMMYSEGSAPTPRSSPQRIVRRYYRLGSSEPIHVTVR